MEWDGAHLRVVVAEDSGTIRHLVSKILTRAGCDVKGAVDGLDAITLCALSRPDVAIVDYEMPGCDGMEVLRRLKASADLSDIQVVILSAHTDPAIARAALEAGAADYVRKPCDPAELVARVRRAGAVRSAADDLRRQVATDELTGLPNRWGMASMLHGVEVGQARRLAVLLADIDHFKHVNDTYGHTAGDLVLKEAAARLGGACPGLTVARWGGEEFLGVAAVGRPEDGFRFGEAMRLAVRAAPVPLDGSELAVTISVGVTVVEHPVVVDEAIEAADTALYQAKNAGRDRCIMAGPPDLKLVAG